MSTPCVISLLALLLQAVVPANAAANHSIDDPKITFTPEYSTLDPSKKAWTSSDIDQAHGGSITWSNDPTAKATVTFAGDAVYVMGGKKYDRGKVNVQIDDLPIETYDAYDPTDSGDGEASIALYFKNGLSNASHTLTLANFASDARFEGNPYMAIDYITFSVPNEGGGSSSNNTALIVGVVVGVVVALALAGLAIFLVRRNRRSRWTGPTVIDTPDLPSEARLITPFTSPNPTPQTATFSAAHPSIDRNRSSGGFMTPPYTPEPPNNRWSAAETTNRASSISGGPGERGSLYAPGAGPGYTPPSIGQSASPPAGPYSSSHGHTPVPEMVEYDPNRVR